ncbi:MAG TPA: lysylphosphatidylglycerol synthase domain-containing protein [Lysobacter sp.]
MSARHPVLRRLRRVAFYAFLAVVAWLLVRYARSVDWTQVRAALADYGAGTLAMAMALTAGSYLLYSGYDLAARRYSHHALPTPRVMAISMVCYAFSLNVGAVVGGAGLRYRLYSHAGIGLGAISRIIAFAVSTSWLGYLLLGGALFASGRVTPPPQWGLRLGVLPWLGAAMLVAAAAYLVACRRTHGRMFHVRGHHFRLPSPSLGMVQLALGATNWAAMGLLLFVLMPPGPSYTDVLGALLLAAVAAAMAHIPAGIGVLEAVFLALLGHRVAEPQLLAALLAYRACYYLGPLLVAIAGYAWLELRGKRAPVPA